MNLRAQQPVERLLSKETREGSGEGGGVSEGLLGTPLKAMSISTNARSYKNPSHVAIIKSTFCVLLRFISCDLIWKKVDYF